MKNACMGRLGGLLRGKEKGRFTLSSWKVVVQDLLLLKQRKTTDTGTLHASKPSSMALNFINNRSRIKTLRDDGNNNGFPNPAGRTLAGCTGFTLIELLVVVLIIGILAAYALPSYRVAVGTSRAATMYALIRSVDQAQEHFYMQTGHYASNLDSLIIAMPAGFKKSDETIIYSADSRCWIMNTRGADNFSFNCSSKDNVRIEKYHKQSFYICWAPQTNDLANRICQNLSGLDTYNNASSDGTSSYAYQIK